MDKLAAAQQAVYGNVFIPAFLEKCAELGRPINTAEERDQMLDIAAQVDAKLAQNNGSSIKKAHAAVCGTPANAAKAAASVKTAASKMLKNDTVRSALQSLAVASAE